MSAAKAAGNGDSNVTLPIYLDNHATTPLDPRVLEAMLPYLTGKFGNAASRNHSFGWEAQTAVEAARKQIADAIGAHSSEIVFTGGATESDNLAIKGIAEAYAEKGNHIITAVAEHKAVLDTCKRLEQHGFKVTYLPVQPDGLVNLERLKDAFTDKTILVSIMAANNEVGTLQPLEEIGKLCRERGVLFHSDAVQALGKVPLNVDQMNLDLASLTAHKLYGPKGCGALYVRGTVRLTALIDGGGHEHGMRSGTLNVPGIVGFAKAVAIARAEMPDESLRISALRDRLKDKLSAGLDQIVVNGSMERRLPGNLNVSFRFVEGEPLMLGLRDIAVSSGAACTTEKIDPSHVLKALGLSDDDAQGAIRFGVGRFNTEAEIDYVAERVIEVVNSLRELSPAYESSRSGS